MCRVWSYGWEGGRVFCRNEVKNTETIVGDSGLSRHVHPQRSGDWCHVTSAYRYAAYSWIQSPSWFKCFPLISHKIPQYIPGLNIKWCQLVVGMAMQATLLALSAASVNPNNQYAYTVLPAFGVPMFTGVTILSYAIAPFQVIFCATIPLGTLALICPLWTLWSEDSWPYMNNHVQFRMYGMSLADVGCETLTTRR